MLFEETESVALKNWIVARDETPAVSSELARIEVMRATRRLNADALPAARSLLDALNLIPLSTGLVREATEVGGPGLHSFDAIHLASALSIRVELSAFVAYDVTLVNAADDAGLETTRPGA